MLILYSLPLHLQFLNKAVDTYFTEDLNQLSKSSTPLPVNSITSDQSKRSIFNNHPNLKTQLPYIKLANLPTPIEQYPSISNLYIKRDDLTNKTPFYGGNKIRKLEFILADALRNHATTVITCGGAGSNHAVATANCAKKLGLKCISVLSEQINSPIVQQNLLLGQSYNAMLSLYKIHNRANFLYEFFKYNNTQGEFPYAIPLGGSSSLGAIGFVNAIFELKEQINNGEMPKPEYIYLPIGSVGTTVGILLGLKATGLKTKVIGVTISSEKVKKESIVKNLFIKTNLLLNDMDKTFPIFELKKEDFYIERNFWGSEYGLFTKEGTDATNNIKTKMNINLDGTYSAKAFAALLNNIQENKLKNKTLLFWNTYCGEDFSNIIKSQNYKALPESFYKYFE